MPVPIASKKPLISEAALYSSVRDNECKSKRFALDGFDQIEMMGRLGDRRNR